MQVTQLHLTNFRNYRQADIELAAQRNLILGDNAQGKSNLLEALEYASYGKSQRTSNDTDLIIWGAGEAALQIDFRSHNTDYKLDVILKKSSSSRLHKTFKVNGVTQASLKDFVGRFMTVTFSSTDLDILRGSPKHRRDWLDNIIWRLKPSFIEIQQSYTKSLSQRNRLLKQLFERGKLTVSDQDQLKVWDQQIGNWGARLIRTRLALILKLLPLASEQQGFLSNAAEDLSIHYLSREPDGHEDEAEKKISSTPLAAPEELLAMGENELSLHLQKLLKSLRYEEIRRKQTLIGPHRDDVQFNLNKANAAVFGSQGQQRSLVLALKLAELKLIKDYLREPPVLLLDDVLAELDEKRQSLLLSAVGDDMQTILTTTHLTQFDQLWLKNSRIFSVKAGTVQAES